jgi:hypothetical protein
MKIFLFCCLAIAGSLFFSKSHSPGFAVSKVVSSLSSCPEWEMEKPCSFGIASLLRQPFHFLGDGAQIYAFESEDRQYVIKFFKKKHLEPKWWMHALSPFFQHQIKRKEKQLSEIFTSCKIAYEKLPLQTGVVYLHLNPTPSLIQPLSVTDQHGKRHLIPLDRCSFIVQRKAELIYERLKRLEKKEQHDALEAIASLIRSRCAEGIGDRDQGVRNNYGFLDDQAVQIDIGSLYRDESVKTPSAIHLELERILSKITQEGYSLSRL